MLSAVKELTFGQKTATAYAIKKHDPTNTIFPYRLVMTHFSVENIIELLLAAIRTLCQCATT